MTIKVEHPNGYMGVLYGKSSMSIYDNDGHECLHTGSRTPQTETELYEVLEEMPRMMQIIAKEFEQTEPQTDCSWK